MKKPNFFILGAPKCGTTSMSSWLAEHPQIFMSYPKEPWFFNTDLVPEINSLDDYEALFKKASEFHKIVGEATTGYLFSEKAVPGIVRYSPDACFLVMLRNPVEMVVSLHNQYLFLLEEEIVSFEEAWRAQGLRQKGECVPKYCRHPRWLLYGKVCRLGEQLTRLYEHVPKDKVYVVFLEDLKKNPAEIYRSVLRFLRVEELDRHDFPVRNQRMRSRYVAMRRLFMMIGSMKKKLKYLGITGNTGLLSSVYTWNQVPVSGVHINGSLREELQMYFRDDIELLMEITQRDLRHWLI